MTIFPANLVLYTNRHNGHSAVGTNSLCPFDCPDSWQKDSTFRTVHLYGETARGTPESEGLERGPAQGFLAKYWDLPAAYHEVPKGKALSPAQSAAFAEMLAAVVRAAHHRGIDDRLIEASLGSNETVEADGGFLVEKDIADGMLRRTFEVSRLSSRVRGIPISARANGLKINALKDDIRATGSRGSARTFISGKVSHLLI